MHGADVGGLGAKHPGLIGQQRTWGGVMGHGGTTTHRQCKGASLTLLLRGLNGGSRLGDAPKGVLSLGLLEGRLRLGLAQDSYRVRVSSGLM